jgi:two-component sensor histidine kinase
LKSRFHLNITQKFITYLILISVIPLVVVGISAYLSFSTALKEEAGLYANALVINQRDYLDLQLEQIESLIANITSVEDITNVLSDTNQAGDAYTNLATQAQIGYILNGYSNLRGLVSIDIFTLTGAHYHVGDTLDASSIRHDVRDQLFDAATHSSQLVHWSGIEDNVNQNSSQEKVLTAAKVITRINRETLQKEPVALFLVNYSLEDLYAHFVNIDLGESAYLMVVDGENRIIYHPDPSQIGQTISDDLERLLTKEDGAYLSNYDNQEMSVTFSRSTLSDWKVISLIPTNTLRAKAASMQTNLFWMLFFSFLFVAVAAWLYSKDVVQPIRQITARFQLMQAGLPGGETRLPARGSDEIGELVMWFNVFVDSLIARRQAEAEIESSLQEKEVLLKEIHHRVKNNLQVISSLLNLQSGFVEPESKSWQALRDSQNRVRSMALIHERIYRSENLAQVNLSEYIQSLATYLLRSYQVNPNRIRLLFDLDEAHLGIETAVPCGLILNELISNALEHAFPDQRQGTIHISLKNQPPDQLVLSIIDDGIGIPPHLLGSQPDSLGSQLVNTLIEQLEGDLVVHIQNGSHFIITFTAPSSEEIPHEPATNPGR